MVEEGKSAYGRDYHKCPTSVQPERQDRLGRRNTVDKVKFFFCAKKKKLHRLRRNSEVLKMVLKKVLKISFNILATLEINIKDQF